MRATVRGLVAFTFSLLSIAVHAAPVDDARASGIAYLIGQQSGDGAWRPAAGLEVQATATALDGLANAGMKNSAPYALGVAWLANADAASVDSLARKMLALKTAGLSVTANDADLLARRNSTTRYLWGAYAGHETGFPDTPLALSARKAALGNYGDTTQLGNTVFCEILPAQRSNGSWSYIKPAATAPASATAGTILPTVYTVLELKAIQLATGWTSSTCGLTYNLGTAQTNGLNFIYSKRNADGGYGDEGASQAVETALAYRVLKLLAPADTRTQDALNWLTANQQPDGSWNGGMLATGMALAALNAAVLPDTDKDGIPDAVEPLTGTQSNVADSKGLNGGNGLAQSGGSTAALLPGATVSEIYSHSLAQSGLSTFALGSGALPPGLALNSAGTISGTPSQTGVFNFTYTAAPAYTRVAQITIADAGTDSDVPTLPEWGAILLGLSLLWAIARRPSLPRGVRV